MNTSASDVIHTLTRIKDYIRWGASRFVAANIFLGHGVQTALDESAALVLHTLGQPYDLPNVFLDSVLTLNERQAVFEIIERRINERKPSAYLTHEALFAGLAFYVDERVLVPRSPIAELIGNHFEPWIEPEQVLNVLDLCTGGGCIAIACAYAFPEAQVDAADISADALAVARINVEKHELGEQVTLCRSDLFSQLPRKPYDIIVSNPPYVSLAEWRGLPAEFHAEPELGFKGGENGLDLVLRILAAAPDYLAEHGILVVEVGSSAQTLADLCPEVPFCWLEFAKGGDGVFLLSAGQLHDYHSIFVHALSCQETA